MGVLALVVYGAAMVTAAWLIAKAIDDATNGQGR